jgi:hypothetical protein
MKGRGVPIEVEQSSTKSATSLDPTDIYVEWEVEQACTIRSES